MNFSSNFMRGLAVTLGVLVAIVLLSMATKAFK